MIAWSASCLYQKRVVYIVKMSVMSIFFFNCVEIGRFMSRMGRLCRKNVSYVKKIWCENGGFMWKTGCPGLRRKNVSYVEKVSFVLRMGGLG